MADPTRPLEVFISYSWRDTELCDRLKAHLASLQSNRAIDVWYDEAIQAGDRLDDLIQKQLDRASVILVLVSADYLSSAYCHAELLKALKRHESGDATVIPVLLRPVDFKAAPISKLQALPQNLEPVSRWENMDEAFADIANGIRRTVEQITANRDVSPSEPENKEPSDDKSAVATATKQQFIELIISDEFEEFSTEREGRLVRAIQQLLDVSDDIHIVRTRRGSVRVTIAISPELAERLFWAVKAGELAEFNVDDAEILGQAAAQAILEEKQRNQEYDVFLCHNSCDKSEVMRVAEKLKEYAILPWLDIWELRPGLAWQKALERQIASIRSAAVFIGANGCGPWQDMELDAFIRQFVQRECPVIPVLLRTCSDLPALPPFLSGMTHVDLRRRNPNPYNRLVWGITGNRIPAANKALNRSTH